MVHYCTGMELKIELNRMILAANQNREKTIKNSQHSTFIHVS